MEISSKKAIRAEAPTIIDRLATLDCSRPHLDTVSAERALHQHYEALGLLTPPIRWVADAEGGFIAARNAVWSAARSAAESAARNAVWSAARNAAWSAAESAARSAAWRAAKNAAESAARNAAWSAAESAARNAAWRAVWSAARSAAESAVWSAVWSAAWSAAESAARSAATQRYISIWLPFVEATEAGLWLFFPLRDEVIAVPRPVLLFDHGLLHCETGPAVWWPHGARYFFWHGVQVPENVILKPTEMSPGDILQEGNAEICRVMLERYGWQRFAAATNATSLDVDVDASGPRELLQIDLPDDEPLVFVSLTDPAKLRLGLSATLLLRVPPTMRTCRDAVAWTFGKTVQDYAPTLET